MEQEAFRQATCRSRVSLMAVAGGPASLLTVLACLPLAAPLHGQREEMQSQWLFRPLNEGQLFGSYFKCGAKRSALRRHGVPYPFAAIRVERSIRPETSSAKSSLTSLAASRTREFIRVTTVPC